MEASDFGQYLKKLRKDKKLTIRQLELYSKVSNAYISQLERGDRGIPSPEILNKLAKPLGVKYEDLMEKAGYIKKEDVVIDALNKGIIKLHPHEKYSNEKLFKEINENPDFFKDKTTLEFKKEIAKIVFENADQEMMQFLIDIYINENKKEVAMKVINELNGMDEMELNELLTFAKFKKSQSTKK